MLLTMKLSSFQNHTALRLSERSNQAGQEHFDELKSTAKCIKRTVLRQIQTQNNSPSKAYYLKRHLALTSVLSPTGDYNNIKINSKQ